MSGIANAAGGRLAAALQLVSKSTRETEETTMKIDRRHLVLPALALGLLAAVSALSLSAEEKGVAIRLEAHRTEQITPDANALDELTAPEPSYSHSDARVEDRATFIK